MSNDIGLAAFVMFQKVIMDVMENVQKRNSIDAATLKRLEQEWIQNLLRSNDNSSDPDKPFDPRDPVYILRSDCWRLAAEVRRASDPKYANIDIASTATPVTSSAAVRSRLGLPTITGAKATPSGFGSVESLRYQPLQSVGITPLSNAPGAPILLGGKASQTGLPTALNTSSTPNIPVWKGFVAGSSSSTANSTLPTPPASATPASSTSSSSSSSSSSQVNNDNASKTTGGDEQINEELIDSLVNAEGEVEWEDGGDEDDDDIPSLDQIVPDLDYENSSSKRIKLGIESETKDDSNTIDENDTSQYIEQIRKLQKQDKQFTSASPTLGDQDSLSSPNATATSTNTSSSKSAEASSTSNEPHDRLEDEELDSQDEDESELQRKKKKKSEEGDDECICFYEEVKKPKGKGRRKEIWSMSLKQGLLRVGPLDYVFHRVKGEMHW